MPAPTPEPHPNGRVVTCTRAHIGQCAPPEPGSSPGEVPMALFMPSDCYTGVPGIIIHPWQEENNKIRFRRPRSPLNGPWLCRRSGKPRRQATGAVWEPTPLGKKLGGPPLPAKCCGGTVRGSFPYQQNAAWSIFTRALRPLPASGRGNTANEEG